MLAIVIATTILIGVRVRKAEPPSALDNVYAVAVLPVTNLSGDPSQEFLSDALTDQLITELARSTTASVTSRTSRSCGTRTSRLSYPPLPANSGSQ
jgi:TolB-like protein